MAMHLAALRDQDNNFRFLKSFLYHQILDYWRNDSKRYSQAKYQKQLAVFFSTKEILEKPPKFIQ
jgi:hypothetical protein